MCVCKSRADNLKEQLERKFNTFADHREDFSSTAKMSLDTAMNWFIKADIVDGVKVTKSGVREVFKQLAITSANFSQFDNVVRILATSKQENIKQVRRKLINISNL